MDQSQTSNISLERKNSSKMTALIASRLIDDNLMQRYGTSLDINMGREFHKYLDKKYQDLKVEFNKIDKDADDMINVDELVKFVNSFSAEVFSIN